MKVIPEQIIESCGECSNLTDWNTCIALQRHIEDYDVIPSDCPLKDYREEPLKLNFKWIQKTGSYQNGCYLFINKIRFGSVDWNGVSSTTKGKYVANLLLPSREYRIYNDDENSLKQKVEVLVTEWFNAVLVPTIKESKHE